VSSHIVSIPNGNIPLGDEHVVFSWHIPLGCEEVMFGLTHNYWLWTCFVHPFFHLFLFFILGHMAKYSFHIMQYFVPCVNRIFQKFPCVNGSEVPIYLLGNRTLLKFLVLQLSFATKIQLHATHVIANLCSCIRQVAYDIQLHATLRMQHVYMMLIYMFIHIYQCKCSCTLCATLLATTIQLIKIWHIFKNLTTSLWTCVTI
jgi:hypothetical protein